MENEPAFRFDHTTDLRITEVWWFAALRLILPLLITLTAVFIPMTATVGGDFASLRTELSQQYAWMTPSLYEAIVIGARFERLDPRLVAALVHAESRGKTWARSPVGALGLMQIMPFWKPTRQTDLTHPSTNLRLGMRIFRGYLTQSRGNLVEALRCYNSGPAKRYYNWAYIYRILVDAKYWNPYDRTVSMR